MATHARKRTPAGKQTPAPDVQAILDLDALALVARLNQSDGEAMIATFTPDQAQTLVDRLKEGADRHWSINPNRSLEMADTIIKIGATRGEVKQLALGLMARGDALKLLGHSQEAWDTLEEAGELFRAAGDEVGWARTRIGRLYLSTNINQVTKAISDGKEAESIFQQENSPVLLARLHINMARLYQYLGQHEDALRYYNTALNSQGFEPQFTGLIYTNIGAIYNDLLGETNKALKYYQLALDWSKESGDTRNTALAELDMALVHTKQGSYVRALQLLYMAHDLYLSENLIADACQVRQLIVENFLSLNRFAEARELALETIKNFRANNLAYSEGHILRQLASAEAQLNNLLAAQNALDDAESIFENMGAITWVYATRLKRGIIALESGDTILAERIASQAMKHFQSSNQQIHFANALLLAAQISLLKKQLSQAAGFAKRALAVAKTLNFPILRYNAHNILGKIAEQQNDVTNALRRYQAAIMTIERVQQGMTIALRSDFVEDKGEALKSLINLYLRINDAMKAVETLERAKSQAFFEYIANHQLLRWPQEDPECRDLITELDRLRDEHHWWYQKLHSEPKDDQAPSVTVDHEDALREVATRERRMRVITEQLYLHSSANAALNPRRAPHLPDIQAALDADTLLVAYYQDGETVWAFAADRSHISAQALPITAAKVERDINFLQLSIDRALTQGAALPGEATMQAQRILKRLYDGLLAPLGNQVATYRRLIVVPYGHLHYLPFHLLHTGAGYLIESHEIVVEPAASYLVQRGPERSGGARVIAHSWAGALPSAPLEGQAVHNLFAGELFQEDAANRQALAAPPTQILHIAAHAEYRLDQPDLSYIELADGQLRTDDLLQQDLSYELVTLSACETGRASVAASDELIGLGRGFLYAGAGALVASLWRVADAVAQRVMTEFYQALHAGASKAAALRHAQHAILAEQPDLHPAFWGAFQLVGDPRPLSHSEGESL